MASGRRVRLLCEDRRTDRFLGQLCRRFRLEGHLGPVRAIARRNLNPGISDENAGQLISRRPTPTADSQGCRGNTATQRRGRRSLDGGRATTQTALATPWRSRDLAIARVGFGARGAGDVRMGRIRVATGRGAGLVKGNSRQHRSMLCRGSAWPVMLGQQRPSAAAHAPGEAIQSPRELGSSQAGRRRCGTGSWFAGWSRLRRRRKAHADDGSAGCSFEGRTGPRRRGSRSRSAEDIRIAAGLRRPKQGRACARHRPERRPRAR